MRLSSHEIESIKSVANNVFGENAVVQLFESRVDDTKKGGDIDFLEFIENKKITL